jgi:N-acylglucosamine-6-phosphate 2-epimerase
MARLARAAAQGGAAGLRVNAPADVRAVKAVTSLPVIGIHKIRRGGRQLITPWLHLAAELCAAGADIVGIEATADLAPEARDAAALVARARQELGVPIMADIASLEEGLAAWEAGADLVATTLSGYAGAGRRTSGNGISSPGAGTDGPDLDLVAALHARQVRVVGEGRYGTPDQVAEAFARGAFAVVVGTAITDPVAITRRFASAAPGSAR